MNIKVRFADLKDIAAIADLDGGLSTAQLIWKLQHREIIIALSKPEGRAIGFIRLEYLWSKQPYISLIRVVPDERRKGVGKKLLAFAESYLAERGLTKLYSSSQEDEPEPQQWHRRVGFTECGIINGINDGVGEVMFVKPLSAG